MQRRRIETTSVSADLPIAGVYESRLVYRPLPVTSASASERDNGMPGTLSGRCVADVGLKHEDKTEQKGASHNC